MISRGFADFLARLRRGGTDKDRLRLAAILELNRSLATAQDRKGVLQLLLDEAIVLFEAERGFLILGAGEGFSVEVARSLDREPVRSPERKISSTVVSAALRGEGIFTEDAQVGDYAAAQSVADMKLRSVLCMPLKVGDEVLGCLYLDHRFRSAVFRTEDLPWFEAFADQGAIALHLHGLLDSVRERAEQAERYNEELSATVVAQAEELTTLRDDLARSSLRHAYPEIIGESASLIRCLHLIDRVVGGDFPVMITGESGCGKELFARAIHANGARANGQLVPVNVSAISPALLESELFGHVKGAFTGADRDRLGLCREADGGVLFLDEVTEMPEELQVKLLRFLEDKVVRPVGGDRSFEIDVRIVAATNRDPLAEVAAGRFREDLYYRLAVVTAQLPPLRERLDDIPLLVEHFIALTSPDCASTASAELLAEMQRRTWPGNLRQLRNEVQRMLALADGEALDVKLLSPEERPSGGVETGTLDLASLERLAIEAAMERSGGNKAEAARLLGISRRALYNKLARD